MNYTQEQLREMSDSDINQAVSNILGVNYLHFNYTSSPSDIMRIASKNKIGVLFSNESDACAAQGPFGNPFIKHENNYMRAICEVFILMKQEQNK